MSKTRKAKGNAGGLVKVSYRVPRSVVDVLETERAARIAAGARKLDVDRSDLVSEAVLRSFTGARR